MPTIVAMTEEEDMIEALIEDMDNWDYETLLSWAQDRQRMNLEAADREEIQFYFDELQG